MWKDAAMGVWNESPQVCVRDTQIVLSEVGPQQQAREKRQPLPELPRRIWI